MSVRGQEPISKPMRAYPEFVNWIDSIIGQRIKNGKDNPRKPQTSARITAAIIRHQANQKIANDIIKADLPPLREKKGAALGGILGAMIGISMIMIIAFIFITMSAVYSKGFNTITDSIVALPTTGPYNLSQYGITTFGNIGVGLNQLKWISVGLIVGMILGFLAGLYLIRLSPFWFGGYCIVAAVLVLAAIYVSRTFETLYNSGGLLGNALQTYGAAGYMMLYLPEIISAVAFIGAIILMVNFPGKETGDLV